jgi:hypothetical protein
VIDAPWEEMDEPENRDTGLIQIIMDDRSASRDEHTQLFDSTGQLADNIRGISQLDNAPLRLTISPSNCLLKPSLVSATLYVSRCLLSSFDPSRAPGFSICLDLCVIGAQLTLFYDFNSAGIQFS